MTEPLAETLLRALSVRHGELSFKDACQVLGLDPPALRTVVTSLPGEVEPTNPFSMQPNYRLTAWGRERLAIMQQRRPRHVISLRLGTLPTKGKQLLSVTASSEGATMAQSVVEVSSYRLAAIRYLLSIDPDGMTSGVTTSAAIDIGMTLLPACTMCLKHPAEGTPFSCSGCVYGSVDTALREAAASGDWVSLELEVEPPWTFVPWEMAARGVDDFLALDSTVSIIRRIGRGRDHGLVLDGDVNILLLVPKTSDGAEQAVLTDEATAIREELQDFGGPDRRLVAFARYFRTVEDIGGAINEVRPHVVHLLGHGSFDGLSLDGETLGVPEIVEQVRHRQPEVMVLGSCFGATEMGEDREGMSLGAALAANGVRRVIAFEGRAEASHSLRMASAFYRELARSGSVEQATGKGRQAMKTGSAYYQWGQLVLFGGTADEN